MYLYVCSAYHNMCICFFELLKWTNASICMYPACIHFFACILLYLMHSMYLYVLYVYACMLIISYLYVSVLHVLVQTSSLPAITWKMTCYWAGNMQAPLREDLVRCPSDLIPI